MVEASAIMRVQGRVGPFLVTILDVSVAGLRLSSPTQFPDGTKVTVVCRGVTVTGEVRYSRDVGRDGFHLGILAAAASGGAVSEAGHVDLIRLFPKILTSRSSSISGLVP